MSTTAPKPAILVNVLTVEPQNQQKLIGLLDENTQTVIKTLQGWIATTLIASADGKQVVIYSQWESLEDVGAMRTDPRMVAYFPKIAELASLSSTVGDIVASHRR